LQLIKLSVGVFEVFLLLQGILDALQALFDLARPKFVEQTEA
jgi:hypothetical protein